jgi:hypothetical protein
VDKRQVLGEVEFGKEGENAAEGKKRKKGERGRVRELLLQDADNISIFT